MDLFPACPPLGGELPTAAAAAATAAVCNPDPCVTVCVQAGGLKSLSAEHHSEKGVSIKSEAISRRSFLPDATDSHTSVLSQGLQFTFN